MISALLLLAVLGFVTAVYADVEAGGDTHYIDNEYDISHLWSARGRLVFFVAVSAVHLSGFVETALVNKTSLLPFLPRFALGVIYTAAVFWLWFDYRLNKRRGKPWDYIGTDPATAAADRTAARLLKKFKRPGRVLFATKVALLAFIAVCYVFVTLAWT